MSDRGSPLFHALKRIDVPFDEERGRARFLDTALAAKKKNVVRVRRELLLAAAAMLFGLFAFFSWRSATALRFSTDTGAGELRAWLATDATKEMPLTFSEGTNVVIFPDSRGRVEQLNSSGATFLLERGEVRAHVVHRTRTDWRFLAGPFEVKVTGTMLDVKWDEAGEKFSVRVDEGAVVVNGPTLGTSQVVRAGEQCDVDLPSRTMRVSSTREIAPVDARDRADAGASQTPEISSGSSSSEISKPAPSASWTTFEARGDYDGAYAAASNAGLASLYLASSSDDLLKLAEVGQLSGHRNTERAALLACRRRFPSSEQSAVAAYELGRASSSTEAATWFDTYLRERPAGPLAREALGRSLEAHAAAGDDAAAKSAATRYLEKYPDGPQAGLAHRVLAGARE